MSTQTDQQPPTPSVDAGCSQVVFAITARQFEIASAWKAERRVAFQGAIGGQFVFEFVQTTIGVICGVRDGVTGERIDLTDYSTF